MTITNEIKEAILTVTGADRQDIINKVAELLNGTVGDHAVEVRTSSGVICGDTVIDLSTRKKNGVQTVKNFMTWEKNNKAKTIQIYF